ncbi:MAG: DUF4738 domain-containing protein [Bacteroidota bacterium]|nr:DUF4738 domain-containing protein [Bacteroidota bacterium]
MKYTLLLIFCLTLFECTNNKHNRITKSPDSILKVPSFKEKGSEHTHWVTDTTNLSSDTIFSIRNHSFMVSIKALAPDENSYVSYLIDKDTFKIKDKRFLVTIKTNRNLIYSNIISRRNFKNKFSKTEYLSFSLMNLWFDSADNKAIKLKTSLCIPDTDNCRLFTIIIDSKGQVQIKEEESPLPHD